MSAAYTLGQPLARRRAAPSSTSVQSQAQAAAGAGRSATAATPSFAALRQKRTETVRSLAASRFDWSHALHEVARTIPPTRG